MRKSILSAVAGVTFLLGIAACSEENKYDSSVVTDIQLYLDDEAYSLNTGSSNKPLFIYASDGRYVANYSTLYRFQLPNGTYRVVATTEADSLPHPGNLNDIVLNLIPGYRCRYNSTYRGIPFVRFTVCSSQTERTGTVVHTNLQRIIKRRSVFHRCG